MHIHSFSGRYSEGEISVLLIWFLFSEFSTVPAANDVQICSPQERRDRIKHWCKIQANVNGKSFFKPWYLSEWELKRITRFILADDKHKVLYCDIAKAG